MVLDLTPAIPVLDNKNIDLILTYLCSDILFTRLDKSAGEDLRSQLLS